MDPAVIDDQGAIARHVDTAVLAVTCTGVIAVVLDGRGRQGYIAVVDVNAVIQEVMPSIEMVHLLDQHVLQAHLAGCDVVNGDVTASVVTIIKIGAPAAIAHGSMSQPSGARASATIKYQTRPLVGPLS